MVFKIGIKTRISLALIAMPLSVGGFKAIGHLQVHGKLCSKPHLVKCRR